MAGADTKVTICAPGALAVARVIAWCNSCQCRRRVIASLYEYYEAEYRCCACGHHPFRDRRRRIDEDRAGIARVLWKRAQTWKKACAMLARKIGRHKR